MPCPMGVDISTCFELHNHAAMFDDFRIAQYFYAGRVLGIISGKNASPKQCTRCGACVKKCPQGIEIPDRLVEVRKRFEGWGTRLLMWAAPRLPRGPTVRNASPCPPSGTGRRAGGTMVRSDPVRGFLDVASRPRKSTFGSGHALCVRSRGKFLGLEPKATVQTCLYCAVYRHDHTALSEHGKTSF